MTLRRGNIQNKKPFQNLSQKQRTDKISEIHKQNITKSKGDITNMEEKTNVTTTNNKKSETKSKINYKEIYDYKTITLAEMQDFIENHHPEDKEEFKKNAIEYVKIKNTDGVKPVYRHMKARKYFCEKYMPELLPKKKDKVKKSESILNW